MTRGHLEMRNISMVFPGVRALDSVNFKASPGQLLALMGENGAGKSTLMKILSGVIPYPQYQGQVLVDGTECRFHSTKEARDAGIAIIHQELNLFPDMSVADNLFLTMEPLRVRALGVIDERTTRLQAEKLLQSIGVNIDVSRPLGDFSVGTQQLVEIVRAIATDATILVLDEPTSALTLSESETLFKILGQLKAQGKTLIYISHRMEEVFRLADRVEILRDGRSVGGDSSQALSPDKVISMMVGRSITDLYPKRQPALGAEVLRVEHLSVQGSGARGNVVKDVSFSVASGEILGIAGLVGAGRTELISAIFGALPPHSVQGSIWVQQKPVHISHPRDAITHGIGLVTEDRKMTGLLLDRSVSENLSLAVLPQLSKHFVVNRHENTRLVRDYVKKLRIKAASPEVEVRTLSGGNQQKIVLAKWLAIQPKVLFLDEPTRGIDVGARQEIYALIDKLAHQGVAVVMVSSDLPEVLGMSDRVLVMRDGRLAGILPRQEANQESVMHLAAGM